MLTALPANIGQLLTTQVERFADKPFLLIEADGRVFSYRQFDAAVNEAAARLVAQGIGKGNRVSLYLTNSSEYFIFYFACFKLGAWAGPVNALLKPQEIEFIVANSEAAVIVTQPDLYLNLADIGERIRSLREIIVVGGRWSVV